MKKAPRMSSWHRFLALARRAWRPVVRKGPWYWLRFALLLAAGSYLGHLLSEAPQLSDLRYAFYQKQVRLEHRGQIYPQHTVLILINDDDYWSDTYQARSPYKRNQLADLLDRLNQAGASTVAFDVDFSSPFANKPDYDFPDYAQEDDLFFAAIRRMCDGGGHVILTAGLTGGSQPPYHRVPTIYDAQRTTMPCLSVGHDGLPSDMRKIAGMVRLDSGRYMDSLSLAIVKVADPVAYERSVGSEDKGFRFGNYLTAQDFSPKQGRQFIFNAGSIAHMNKLQLRKAIADRIVIVGGGYSGFAYGTGDQIDLHNSPGGIEVGAMLHANYVEAELNQDSTFTPISDNAAEMLEWSLAFGLAVISALELPSLYKWGSVVVCFLFSILLTYVLMQNLGLFLDFFIPFLMIVVHVITEEFMELRREVHHLRHAAHGHRSSQHFT